MSTVAYRFIEPLDVLFLRGNRAFGDPGSYGESLIPPWPSVAAGAIRSRMLVDRHIDVDAFAKGHVTDDAELGTPEQPGSFVVAGFYLARRAADGNVEVLLPPPADLVVSRSATGALELSALTPQTLDMPSSFPLAMPPVLAQGSKRGKPESGYWLTQPGWARWLRGELPAAEQLVHASELWSFDARIGIGLDGATRSVEEGKLFSAQAVVMHKQGHRLGPDAASGAQRVVDYDVGFLSVVSGATPPAEGLLRFGGDGRAAAISAVDIELPQPDYQAIADSGRCRLVLTSPGLFPMGWQLPGTDANKRVRLAEGVRARVVSAVVARAESLSGWDLAKKQPKVLQRVVPAGSVYWLDELEASPEALRKLVENGLWGGHGDNSADADHAARRAEGFNRLALAAWARG
ncbi:MAG: type III-B CRISPR module-associated protein Cmr3 [Alcaligenaceae bacterium]|nr:type III-B CRISPR module-associated protein Cmr3 [Alcaligenaceae bacterium]